MLIFIEVGIDEVFEEVVPGLRVEVNVVANFLFIPNLRELIGLGFGNFVKGCEGFPERLLLLVR
jgi:hypothetical protein